MKIADLLEVKNVPVPDSESLINSILDNLKVDGFNLFYTGSGRDPYDAGYYLTNNSDNTSTQVLRFHHAYPSQGYGFDENGVIVTPYNTTIVNNSTRKFLKTPPTFTEIRTSRKFAQKISKNFRFILNDIRETIEEVNNFYQEITGTDEVVAEKIDEFDYSLKLINDVPLVLRFIPDWEQVRYAELDMANRINHNMNQGMYFLDMPSEKTKIFDHIEYVIQNAQG